MFCRLSPQGNHAQVSTFVNLLSTHTIQATSQSHIQPGKWLFCFTWHWKFHPPVPLCGMPLTDNSMANASASRPSPYLRLKEMVQQSLTQPFNAIINTTYSFSQPRQRPAERRQGPPTCTYIYLNILRKHRFHFCSRLCFYNSPWRINLNLMVR